MFFDIEYDDSMCGTNQVHFKLHIHHSHKAHDNGTVHTYTVFSLKVLQGNP